VHVIGITDPNPFLFNYFFWAYDFSFTPLIFKPSLSGTQQCVKQELPVWVNSAHVYYRQDRQYLVRMAPIFNIE
jgi:hypothetical protein